MPSERFKHEWPYAALIVPGESTDLWVGIGISISVASQHETPALAIEALDEAIELAMTDEGSGVDDYPAAPYLYQRAFWSVQVGPEIDEVVALANPRPEGARAVCAILVWPRADSQLAVVNKRWAYIHTTVLGEAPTD